MDHILRYHDDPNVKMIVVLGEVYIHTLVLYQKSMSAVYFNVVLVLHVFHVE